MCFNGFQCGLMYSKFTDIDCKFQSNDVNFLVFREMNFPQFSFKSYLKNVKDVFLLF